MQMRTALTKMMTEEKALAMLSGSERCLADEYVDGVAGVSACRVSFGVSGARGYLQIWRLLDAGTPCNWS